MGDCQQTDLQVGFARLLKSIFLGSQVTTDAGLLAYRELEEALRLTALSPEHLQDSRLGRNKQLALLSMLLQSIYSRLAMYEDLLRWLALPKAVRHWSLTTLRDKLIKIGTKVTKHSKYTTFNWPRSS